MLVMVALWALTIAGIFVYCLFDQMATAKPLPGGRYLVGREILPIETLLWLTFYLSLWYSFIATAIYATICGALFVVHFATRPDPPPR